MSFTDFVDYMKSNNRDNFSYEGYQEIFDHLESEYNYQYEFNSVEVDDRFDEYESLEQYNQDNDTEYSTVDELATDCYLWELSNGNILIDTYF